MFKLVSLLAAGMFVTLLIGGADKGQIRQGLVGADPATRPVLRESPVLLEQKPNVTKAPAVLANFSPVKVKEQKSAPIAGAFQLDDVVAVAEPAPSMTDTLSVMYVSSTSVNVRGGPSTDYEVLGRLTLAEAVTVVTSELDGWVQIRIEGDGLEGFIAARLLTQTDPAQ